MPRVLAGQCCFFGKGTAQDFAQACLYFNKAADVGNSQANVLLAKAKKAGADSKLAKELLKADVAAQLQLTKCIWLKKG